MELLTRLNTEQGITVLMVTHEPEMAAFARRVVKFRDGRVESDQMQMAAGQPSSETGAPAAAATATLSAQEA